jgi:hypothetical protein
MPEIRTEVAIGVTDGFRYIAIKPPLSEIEIDLLVNDGLIGAGREEQITLGPNCTMLRGGWNTERAQMTASSIARTLRPLRGSVYVDSHPVTLSGYQSSPFNPITR